MYYIDTDGKSVLKAETAIGGGVLLSDGQHVPEDKLMYLFVGDSPTEPFVSTLLRQNDNGEWEYRINGQCNAAGWYGGEWTPVKRDQS
jgi:hypothetical protein